MSRDRVLVIGATGNLGGRVVTALSRLDAVDVLAASRNGGSRPEWDAAGVRAVRADLAGASALHEAVRGVRTIISTVQGEEGVIVDGQSRLLDAALAEGVERLVPSDFSIDSAAIPVGVNPLLDLRRRFAERLEASGLGWTIFYNGGFTEVMLAPFFGMVDEAAGEIRFWGDGQAAMDLTTLDDSAAFVAAAALDPASLNRRVRVAGDEISPLGIRDAYAAAGRDLAARSLGSIEAGYAELDRQLRSARPSWIGSRSSTACR
jgi:uncharacterized protein YbjT (DUF2867 family)